MIPVLVQQADALLGVVALGQRVPGSMVQNVAQQQEPLRLFPLKRLQHAAAGSGAAVDV